MVEPKSEESQQSEQPLPPWFYANMVHLAEGVEQAHELAALQEVGVSWAQGYYLGRPEASPFDDCSDTALSLPEQRSSDLTPTMSESARHYSDQNATT